MPEIWLNYGMTDVVLDIKAENLDQQIDTQGGTDAKNLTDSEIGAKLEGIDTTKKTEIVVLNNSEAVQKILLKLFEKCEQNSRPIPKVLADKKIRNSVRAALPEGSVVSDFEGFGSGVGDDSNGDDNNGGGGPGADLAKNPDLIFIGEMELDGLFGFETIATRLLKKFGKEQMLLAYESRKGNLPIPGQEEADSLAVAQKFAENFEISGIEIIANSGGVVDLSIGHPSSTVSISKSFAKQATKQIETHRTMIVSTGKQASNDTLSRSLCSIWNCSEAIKNNGLAILLAECKDGIGSEAIEQYIEGRMSLDRLQSPAKYVGGMEDLLFLTEIQKKLQIGLVSILPEFYSKKLNMLPFNGVKHVMDYILKTQGAKQKVTVIADGARVLLR